MTDLGLIWGKPISNENDKKRLGAAVAARAQSGQVIGAGSGSTSFLTLLEIGKRAAVENLQLQIVPSSIEIQWACEAIGLPVLQSAPREIDWCFDGADEVDNQQRLIKGRGGAMYRERQIFEVAKKIYVIADTSKSVERLGSKFPVPVEVEANWLRRTHQILAAQKNVRKAELRYAQAKDGPVITESGCVILDVWYDVITDDEHIQLMSLPGVCGTGIFSGFDFERVS